MKCSLREEDFSLGPRRVAPFFPPFPSRACDLQSPFHSSRIRRFHFRKPSISCSFLLAFPSSSIICSSSPFLQILPPRHHFLVEGTGGHRNIFLLLDLNRGSPGKVLTFLLLSIRGNQEKCRGRFMESLAGPRVYSCSNCRNEVCLHDDIISKAFQGRNGRAFLFSHAMNIVVGPKEDRQLTTGLHTVADIYCRDCREVLGWKYERAYEETQKYKEGKFIFEKLKIVKENW